MVLVAGEHRRGGLGTQLLKRCIAVLNEAGQVPVLDATPEGRSLYRILGFEDVWSYQRLVQPNAQSMSTGPAPDCRGTTIHPIADADWSALCAYDAAAFGADRSALLQRLRGRLRTVELVAKRRGQIAGFMLGRNGRSAAHIGPLVAEEDTIARALLARALPTIQGPIYLDLADAKIGIRKWLAECGFSTQRPFTRMLYRRAKSYDDTSRTFAVVGPEFG